MSTVICFLCQCCPVWRSLECTGRQSFKRGKASNITDVFTIQFLGGICFKNIYLKYLQQKEERKKKEKQKERKRKEKSNNNKKSTAVIPNYGHSNGIKKKSQSQQMIMFSLRMSNRIWSRTQYQISSRSVRIPRRHSRLVT